MFIAIVLWIVAFAFVLVTSINMIRRAIKTKHCTAEANADVVEIAESGHAIPLDAPIQFAQVLKRFLQAS